MSLVLYILIMGLLFSAVIILPIRTISMITKAMKNRVYSYTRFEKFGIVTNIILSILYIPYCFYSWGFVVLFGLRGGEIIDSGQTTLIIANISSCVAAIMPFICLASMIASVKLRENEQLVWSFTVQFIPAIIGALILIVNNMLLI